jgi:hypothetical protein
MMFVKAVRKCRGHIKIRRYMTERITYHPKTAKECKKCQRAEKYLQDANRSILVRVDGDQIGFMPVRESAGIMCRVWATKKGIPAEAAHNFSAVLGFPEGDDGPECLNNPNINPKGVSRDSDSLCQHCKKATKILVRDRSKHEVVFRSVMGERLKGDLYQGRCTANLQDEGVCIRNQEMYAGDGVV